MEGLPSSCTQGPANVKAPSARSAPSSTIATNGALFFEQPKNSLLAPSGERSLSDCMSLLRRLVKRALGRLNEHIVQVGRTRDGVYSLGVAGFLELLKVIVAC